MARLARKLKQDVEAIALPEGRMVGSTGHEKARRYLLGRMEALGLEPFAGDSLEQTYSWDGDDFVNLVGVIPGASPSAEAVVIGAHYHDKTDTMEKLNFAKMARMTDYLVAVAEAVARQTLEPHDAGPVDTTEFEIRRIKRACGVALPHVLKLFGINRLETRADISALAGRLLDLGL